VPKVAESKRWYLPSDKKGTWAGKPGESTFRLKEPIKVDKRLVHEIHYHNGIPILDKFKLPGKTVTIVLTGEHRTDLNNAKKAWQKLHSGKQLPSNSTFHHDLLHAVEEAVIIDGKKTKVLVGKMHLVPTAVNEVVSHEGSAAVARKFYREVGTDVAKVKILAAREATLVGTAGTLVASAARKIVPGKIAKSVLPFVGRSVVRVIPFAVTGLAIIEFSDNVQAHGVGGAVARAVPVLGDLIAAHDFGSELAQQIEDDAKAQADADFQAMNQASRDAWAEATQQMIDAYRELAPSVQVTNQRQSSGDPLVDPNDIADALQRYRDAMGSANYLRATKGGSFNYSAAAKKAKQELKDDLTHACQRKAPPKPTFDRLRTT